MSAVTTTRHLVAQCPGIWLHPTAGVADKCWPKVAGLGSSPTRLVRFTFPVLRASRSPTTGQIHRSAAAEDARGDPGPCSHIVATFTTKLFAAAELAGVPPTPRQSYYHGGPCAPASTIALCTGKPEKIQPLWKHPEFLHAPANCRTERNKNTERRGDRAGQRVAGLAPVSLQCRWKRKKR